MVYSIISRQLSSMTTTNSTLANTNETSRATVPHGDGVGGDSSLQRPKAPASMDSLPDELILKILADVSTDIVLKAREASPTVARMANTVLAERLSTLYIHPSIGSLRKATEICAHPIYAEGIKEVVLLGNVAWRDLEKAYPGYRNEGLNGRKAEKEGRFNAWPIEFPPAKGTFLELTPPLPPKQQQEQQLLKCFEDGYKPLIAALAKLPNLEKLSFAEHVDKPGFNLVAQNTIDSHMKKYIDSPPATPAKPSMRRSDGDVLYNLLVSPELKFTSLCLQTQLPFTENILKSLDQDSLPDFTTAMSTLTNLELHVHLGRGEFGGRLLGDSLLHDARRSLRNLKIVLIPNAAVKKANAETVLNGLLPVWEGYKPKFPKLESFEVVLGEAPARTSLSSMNDKKNRNLRPTCQLFDMVRFLSHHRSTLTHVRFSNIIFAYHDPGEEPAFSDPMTLTAHETTTMILDHLELYPGALKHFDWTVNVIGHDRRCNKGDDAPLNCKQYNCGFYVNAGLERTTLAEFSEMAEGIDIYPDCEMRMWDFGEYAMQALEQRRRFGLFEGEEYDVQED